MDNENIFFYDKFRIEYYHLHDEIHPFTKKTIDYSINNDQNLSFIREIRCGGNEEKIAIIVDSTPNYDTILIWDPKSN